MARSKTHFETHITVESPGVNAVAVLQDATGLAKQRIKLAMTQGAVWMTRGKKTQRLRRAKRSLQMGDELHLYYDKDILAVIPPEPTLVADVDSYSVWRKPYGLRSQGSKWGDHCTIARWVERNMQPERPAYTVHRLDRAANGLMLLAHTRTVAATLSELFQKRAVEKHYRALVTGDFSTQASTVRVEASIDDRAAASEFSLLETIDGGAQSVVDVRIETGRKHQIRRHLAGLGFPIVGDRLYGAADKDAMDLQLTAYLLAFECPVSGRPVEYRLSD